MRKRYLKNECGCKNQAEEYLGQTAKTETVDFKTI